MTYVPNPFRVRLAEQQRDTGQFLRTFGAGMLDTLPDAETAWDRLIVLRSAPGAGKTSLLRMFTPQALVGVNASPEDFAHLKAPLSTIGAITDRRLGVLGILVSLGKDYRALIDLGPGGRGSDIVFFRLLDARIIVRLIEAVLAAAGLRFPADAHRVTFAIREGSVGQQAVAALERLLAPTPPPAGLEFRERREASAVNAQSLLDAARLHERAVLRLLDSLLPVDWATAHGHSRLYALHLLSGIDVLVNGIPQDFRPVVLFDDVHDLADGQRRALYTELMDRSLDVGRWVAERYAAMRDDELLTDASPEGRDVAIIRLEDAMSTGVRGGRSRTPERLFQEIANRRARAPLSLAGYETDAFSSLLRHRDDVETSVAVAARVASRDAVDALCEEHRRYKPWIRDATAATAADNPLAAAVRWRELQILIERDLRRPAPTLFEEDPPDRPYGELTSSSTRGAARLFLAREHNVPYYAGSDMLATLASRNVEQYLGLAGDLFDLMLAAVVLKRRPSLPAADQHQYARVSSRRLWEAIPQRVPYGDDVAALLHAIAANGRSETYRPNAPYAPGVTGTAFSYFDRPRLVGDRKNSSVTRLGRALASAIAHNLLEVDQPNKTKNGTWTVLYLNRLLCPYFGLPLQRGGFREQPIGRLGDWLEHAAAIHRTEQVPDPDTPLPGVDRTR